MTEEPQQPEGEAPEEETPEGAPGEPGEGTPSETAPEPDSAGDEETAPLDAEAPGPEIEGLEELGQAAPGGGEEAPAEEEPPAAEAEEEAPGEEAPAEEEPPAAEAEEEAPAEEATPAEPEKAPAERPRGRRGQGAGDQEEVIPGAHLEPDLVLEEQRPEGEYGEYDEYAEAEGGALEEGEGGEDAVESAPVAHTPLELAADARYNATGKRKTAIARVILKPGEGTYTINGRHLDEYFPRVRLQRMASQPLEAAGYQTRMDVVARIHGGGVSAQANALRHGIARALVEADPALRTEMKRRGYLTRDPREKERKKAGLKKARKRPQFSKR
jgi:small subunit ribosomal protein S9